jgi:hypothetical protein
VGVLGVSGALLLRNGESPGAVPTLPTSVISSSTPTAELPATQAAVVLPATATLPPAATATSANTPTTAPTATELPTNTPEPAPVLLTIGGADKIAYLDGNNIWAANLDGSGLIQLTSDATSKSYLRWMPDGQSLSYLSGKCIQAVTLEGEVRIVTCFNNSEYLDAFEISPDGTQVVISLDRQLYLLPFDLEGLSQANSHGDLAALATCPELAPYQRNSARMVRWSRDGSQWAALVIGVLADGRRGDLVNVFAVDNCIANPRIQLQFPEPHFTFREYEKNPGLESIAWDGDALFAFHGFTRNDGFGELHIFNMETYAASLSVNPVNGVCCYRDPQWSPDGTHLLFVFQNYLQGADSTAQIYYIPYGSIGTGAAYEPLPLPDLRDPRAKPWPVLRPAAGP